MHSLSIRNSAGATISNIWNNGCWGDWNWGRDWTQATFLNLCNFKSDTKILPLITRTTKGTGLKSGHKELGSSCCSRNRIALKFGFPIWVRHTHHHWINTRGWRILLVQNREVRKPNKWGQCRGLFKIKTKQRKREIMKIHRKNF